MSLLSIAPCSCVGRVLYSYIGARRCTIPPLCVLACWYAVYRVLLLFNVLHFVTKYVPTHQIGVHVQGARGQTQLCQQKELRWPQAGYAYLRRLVHQCLGVR